MSAQPARPVLSIIIPTINRARFVVQTVEQVFRQKFESFELIVVDQSSPQQKALVVAGLQPLIAANRMTYLPVTSLGISNARNEGLALAQGQIILFLDDDVILLGDDFLQAHVDAYADAEVGGVTGRMIERVNRENSRRTVNRITRGGRTLINLTGQTPCDIDLLKGANMSVRGAAIRGMGGFDRNYTGTALLEEADFSERLRKASWRIRFEPKAELFHLSAPAGGARVRDASETLFYRFRCTAYFVRKHRGWLGTVPFVLTHLAIGALKTAQIRQRNLPAILLRGALEGLRTAGAAADDAIGAGSCKGSDRKDTKHVGGPASDVAPSCDRATAPL